MSKGNVLAIDLAKNYFQVHLAAADGQVLARKKLIRSKLALYAANVSAECIVMEACAGANYWARTFKKAGVKEVKLIAPQFVKPFVKTNKNDANDAEAIAEAAARKTMRFVPPKTTDQQDMSAIHCIRSRLVANRTALTNQIRGIMAEYGVVVGQGHAKLRNMLSQIAGGFELGVGDLSSVAKQELIALYDEFRDLDRKISAYDEKIKQMSEADPRCQELIKITGIGPLTASAVIAHVNDVNHFKNGRQFAAYLGLVPRQNSTGGKTKLGGISKRGDTYLRTLLIHGCRASLVSAHKRTDYRSRWSAALKEKKGINRAAVALANRNARTIYALLKNGSKFDLKRPGVQSRLTTGENRLSSPPSCL